jgi:predicted alpha-1,6-mannanase (GH76 family)
MAGETLNIAAPATVADVHRVLGNRSEKADWEIEETDVAGFPVAVIVFATRADLPQAIDEIGTKLRGQLDVEVVTDRELLRRERD